MGDEQRRRALKRANEVRLRRAGLNQADLSRELRDWSELDDSQKDALLNRWLDEPPRYPRPPL